MNYLLVGLLYVIGVVDFVTKSLLEKLLVCKGKADQLARRDPRNVKELKDRIVWERLKKILTHRYGRYTD